MTLSQLKKKYRHHIDDYEKNHVITTIITIGKYLPKKDLPKGYEMIRIEHYGPINDNKNHTYMVDIYRKKKL